MASVLQPVYDVIGLGDADFRAKVFYITGFIASVGVIHFLGTRGLIPFISVENESSNA